MNNKYRYLAKNTLLFSISSFGSKILSFLFVRLYTSVLSTEEYGAADLIATTASLLLFVVTINISDAVVRFAMEKKELQEGIFSYGLRIILRGQCLFGVLLIVFSVINPFEWKWYFYLFLYLTVFVNSFYQISTYYLRAIDEVKTVAIAGIVVTVVTIASNILFLLLFKIGLVGYLLSMILGTATATGYCFYKIIISGKLMWQELCDRQTQKAMLTYSFPLIFNGISWWLNSSLDRYTLTLFWGVGINGIYAAASKIPTILMTLQGIFSEAWNLSAIKEFDKSDADGFFGNTYVLYNSFAVIGASILIILNCFISRILLSPDFYTAWQYSSILIVSVVFSGLSGFVGSVFSVIKKTGLYAASTVIAAAVNLVLNLLLIPRWNAIGAAIATLISFAIVWGIRTAYAGNYIKWRINFYKDILAYILLIVQLIMEHADTHCYLGQLVILITIVIIYRNVLSKLYRKVIEKVKH